MNYYIADLHLGHENIIRMSRRPFSSVQEMNEAIIDGWNRTVTPEDDVYVLGDVAYKGDAPSRYIPRLNGRKHLIVGNHDGCILRDSNAREQFVEIHEIEKVYDGIHTIVLCHYPLAEWDGYFKGALHFYGHVHNNHANASNRYMDTVKNAYNVGVDEIGFVPLTAKQIIEKTRKKLAEEEMEEENEKSRI